MNVLSLCDGIACGRIALERAGIKVDKYYASEINKPSIKVALDNYPDIIELGDIKNWNKWDIQWEDIDLLIGGTPCQDFSQLGKEKLNFDGERSGMFFENGFYICVNESVSPYDNTFLIVLSAQNDNTVVQFLVSANGKSVKVRTKWWRDGWSEWNLIGS